MPEFRAKIIPQKGAAYYIDITASTATEALYLAAETVPIGSYKQIEIPDLNGLQRFTEWLKKINERFENA